MKSTDIIIGETYNFTGARKSLKGPFTVKYKKRVWRRVAGKRANVTRFFNEKGEAARAEELEPRELFLDNLTGEVYSFKCFTNGGWDITNQKDDLPF